MPPRSQTYIALLRGINLGGSTTLRMTDLRAACEELGWSAIRTYIQSGNVVFRSNAGSAALEAALERTLAGRHGRDVAVVVRSATVWRKYLRNNPFPEASGVEPNLVMLALSKAPPKRDAVEALRDRAANGEMIASGGGAIWLRFQQGVAKTKLTPAVLARLVGSPVTMRNWRTVVALDAMARG